MNPKPTAARNRHVMTDEDIQRMERTQQWPSPAFKKNYRLARVRLGLSSPRVAYPRLSKHSHMHWKFETFAENVRWIWEQYLEQTASGIEPKAMTMIRLTAKTFGIIVTDIRGPCRDATVSMPRMVAMAMLRKDGIEYPFIRRAFHKDQKTIAYAAMSMQKHTELLNERPGGRGHSFVRQSARRVQTRIPEVAKEDGQDDQARPDCSARGFDRGEG